MVFSLETSSSRYSSRVTIHRIGGTPPSDRAAVRAGTKMGRRTFRCLLSGEPLEYKYTRAQANEQKPAMCSPVF